jgi:fimbrial chaperone protein
MSWFSSSTSKLKSLGLAFLLTLSQTALGEGLRVSPLKLEFNEDSNSALVRISNDGAEKFNVQLDAMSWTQDDTGQDQHTPTSDIVFFPRIFSIEPGDQRIARVGYEGAPAGSKELTYRLYAQELPVEEPGVTQMKFAIRMSIPIFVTPDQRQSGWDIDNIGLVEDGLSIRIENSGNHFISVGAIQMTGRTAAGEELFTLNEHGWYVLAGRSRVFSLGRARNCEQLETLEVAVTRGDETRTLTQSGDSTVCRVRAH